MESKIFKILEENEFVEMETQNDMLTIYFRKFFGTKKEYLFQLNAKAVDDCKTKKTANKKIEKYISRGFVLSDI